MHPRTTTWVRPALHRLALSCQPAGTPASPHPPPHPPTLWAPVVPSAGSATQFTSPVVLGCACRRGGGRGGAGGGGHCALRQSGAHAGRQLRPEGRPCLRPTSLHWRQGPSSGCIPPCSRAHGRRRGAAPLVALAANRPSCLACGLPCRRLSWRRTTRRPGATWASCTSSRWAPGSGLATLLGARRGGECPAAAARRLLRAAAVAGATARLPRPASGAWA